MGSPYKERRASALLTWRVSAHVPIPFFDLGDHEPNVLVADFVKKVILRRRLSRRAHCRSPKTEILRDSHEIFGVRRAVVGLVRDPTPPCRKIRLSRVARRGANRPRHSVSKPSLKSTLQLLPQATPAPRDVGKPRLAIDRVFTLADGNRGDGDTWGRF